MANEKRVRSNLKSGTLTAALLTEAGPSTMESAELADFPAITSTEHAAVTIDNEIVWITAHTASATTATIARAKEGSSAAAHSNGADWIHAPTKADFEDYARGQDYSQYHQVGSTPYERLYVAGLVVNGAAVSSAWVQGTFIAVPFVFARGGTIDQLSIHVSSAVASSVARVGVYANVTNAGQLYPGALVVESGEILTDSTGFKGAAVSAVLEPGALHWAAFLGGVANPATYAVNRAHLSAILGKPGGNLNSNDGASVRVAQAYGALPSTFPSGATVDNANNVPAIGIRYST